MHVKTAGKYNRTFVELQIKVSLVAFSELIK